MTYYDYGLACVVVLGLCVASFAALVITAPKQEDIHDDEGN